MSASSSQQETRTDDDDGFLGGRITTLLIVGGAILFVLPEPITSVLGVLAVGAGVVAWLAGELL